MKIVLKENVLAGFNRFAAGTIVDIPNGKELIERGLAELVEETKAVKTAEIEEPRQTKTTKTSKKARSV